MILHLDGSTSTKSSVSQLWVLSVSPVYHFPWLLKTFTGTLNAVCNVNNSKIIIMFIIKLTALILMALERKKKKS